MGIVIEMRLCDQDRERYGGPEWMRLDVDKLLDLPARQLRRYEGQTGYPIERAIDQAGPGMPAVAGQVLVWLARKQNGLHRNTPTGEAEPFDALDDLKTMRMAMRRAADEQPGDDADPPAETKATSRRRRSTPAP
jgi:hypothetical protein